MEQARELKWGWKKQPGHVKEKPIDWSKQSKGSKLRPLMASPSGTGSGSRKGQRRCKLRIPAETHSRTGRVGNTTRWRMCWLDKLRNWLLPHLH